MAMPYDTPVPGFNNNVSNRIKIKKNENISYFNVLGC
jgi:hypothetical protein